MTDATGRRWNGWLALLGGVALIAVCTATPWGRAVSGTALASLRIATPAPVTALAAPAGSGGSRQLQATIGTMVADSLDLSSDEPDNVVATVDSAAARAGFVPALPATRTDKPTFTVLGARTASATVHPSQLHVILVEAGERETIVPTSAANAPLVIRTARAIRVEYGHCPTSAAATLQNQLTGPPPPSGDNSDCIAITESRPVVASVPAGVDMAQLAGVGLQLAGMNPEQLLAFQRLFTWQQSLSLSLPRGMRSSHAVQVNDAPAILFLTGSRRGPAYALLWVRGDLTCVLTGYGNSADAVAIAATVQ